MKRASLLLALVLAVAPAVAGGPQPGEFRANIRPDVTEVNPEDYEYLAKYYELRIPLPGGPPYWTREFQWCWSQQVRGVADLIQLEGEWVFCGHEDLVIADPFTGWLEFGPELYGIPGIIKTEIGEIYTWTTRAAGWNRDALEGFGGLTRFFGGTGTFNYALGWTTDRPGDYPPTSWVKSQGQITAIGEDNDDHPSWYPYPEAVTRVTFPARVPGNIEVPGDEDYFIFEAKAGWRYNFGTTLGTLDDSLIALDGYIEGPEECYFGRWREDDGQWDGEGSVIGAFTAPADCTYLLVVIDWGRAGTSYKGTYTFWGEEYPPTQGTDADNDGVPDDVDLCPGTVIPEAVPTVRLGLNRFALTDSSGVFQTVREPGTGPGPVFTISDTGGCSCEQIVEATGGALRQLRVGCTLGTIRDWVDQVNP